MKRTTERVHDQHQDQGNKHDKGHGDKEMKVGSWRDDSNQSLGSISLARVFQGLTLVCSVKVSLIRLDQSGLRGLG